MAQLLGPAFGLGTDGHLTISSNTTDSPIVASCSGAAAGTSLSATNASFSAGQLILIHQTRGTGVGQWELNRIDSYVAGTITTVLPLAYTYTDSGASQAQVLVVKEYTGITINGGTTLSSSAWGGNTGGILAYACSGKTVVTGTINGNARGFRGGAGGPAGSHAYQGESQLGIGTAISPANGGGGGGGAGTTTGDPAGSGGGGGYGSVGSEGQSGGGAPNNQGGAGGGTYGQSNLTEFNFGSGGGGGGGSHTQGTGGAGGAGGAGIMLITREISITGLIRTNGANGANIGNPYPGPGGGGAGGSVLIKTANGAVGTSKVTTTGGTGGSNTFNGGKHGGNGGVGRIRIEACSLTGSTNPGASESIGGHDYCGAIASIIE